MSAARTSIEWTDATWNPVTGCSKVSEGCRHCYAERMAARLQAMGVARYRDGFSVTLQHDVVGRPLKWRKPMRVFVNSMSDLFHEDVPEEFIKGVFETMVEAHWHQFQVLTKRSDRMRRMSPLLPWPSNVWMGVSVEREDVLYRVDHVRQVPAAIRFVSAEPLLGPLPSLSLDGIDWVIVGGESGPGARPLKAEWAMQLRDACVIAGVPFFFKQWGGVQKRWAGRALEGREWSQYPTGGPAVDSRRVRQPKIPHDAFAHRGD